METETAAGPTTGTERGRPQGRGPAHRARPLRRRHRRRGHPGIRRGEVLGLVGESASGKTTAGTSLLGYQRRGAKIAGGSWNRRVRRAGHGPGSAARGPWRPISYVPQDPSASLNPALRIGTQLMEILEVHASAPPRADREARLAEMMAEVLLPSTGIPAPIPAPALRRPAAARGHRHGVRHPATVIVLDEPTTALDVTTQAHVLETIATSRSLRRRGALHHARPRGGRQPRRPYRRDVRGPTRRDRYARRALRRRPPPLHAQAARLDARYHWRARPRGIPGWAPARASGRRLRLRAALRLGHRQCREEYPPVDDVSPGHRVRCWRFKEVGAKALDTDIHLRDRHSCERPRSQACHQRARRDRLLPAEGDAARHRRQPLRAPLPLTRGDSGSGKTLARCIAGLHRHNFVGDMEFIGKPLARDARERPRATRQAIQYIFQSPYGSLNPRKTIGADPLPALKVFLDLPRRDGGTDGEGARTGGAGLLGAEPLPRPALRRRAPACAIAAAWPPSRRC